MPDPARSPRPRVLLQLDTDAVPSVFDAVVALDSGADHLLRVGGVRADSVRDHVHGLIFTRGGDDLRRSAIFLGGADVETGEKVLEAIGRSFFGPLRVSVLFDGRGANTTAAAAVVALERSLGQPIDQGEPIRAIVVGAGPVGTRVAQLLARLGATVRIGVPFGEQDRTPDRFALGPDWPERFPETTALVAAGPAGVAILPAIGREVFPNLRVAIDLNAAPPVGLGNIEPNDADRERDGVRVWGALGVGNLKMKVHRAAVRALFDAEPTVLDRDEVFALARRVLGPGG